MSTHFTKSARLSMRPVHVGAPLLLAAFLLLPVSNAPADPVFQPAVSDPFGMLSVPPGIYTDLGDLDGDGDLDLCQIGNGQTSPSLQWNTGNSTNPAFDNTVALGITVGTTIFNPFCLADLDGDGDLDYLGTYTVGASNYGIEFFENTGGSASPAFAAKVLNPFGLSMDYYYFPGYPETGDLDGDGDLDLLMGVYQNLLGAGTGGPLLGYFENTGNSTNPQFATPVFPAFGLVDVSFGSFTFTDVELADVDNDDDLDMFVRRPSLAVRFFRNTGSPISPAFSPLFLSDPFGLSLATSHMNISSGDLDSDGDFDMLYSNLNVLRYARNDSDVVEPTVTITHDQSATTSSDIVAFNIDFSESVGNTFTATDLTLTGTLAGSATIRTAAPDSADPNYVAYVKLNAANLNGTIGVSVTGVVDDSVSNPMVVPVSSPLYTIANFPKGDVNKNGTFDLADVALLADANLSLVTLP